MSSLEIGFLVYPGVTLLDVVSATEVLARLPGARVQTIWKSTEALKTDSGLVIVPNTDFASCPKLDVICAPGGTGQPAIMDDPDMLAFLRAQGETARYVTSVCTGSVILAAAGLLEGYKSACHWAWREKLRAYGAEPVAERVVQDRNRFSGGGVTSGVDFGLTLAREIAGEDIAKAIQLAIEYDPGPPFDVGSPERATPELVAFVCSMFDEELPADWKTTWVPADGTQAAE